METTRTIDILGIVLAVLGALLALLVVTVAGPCSHDDGSVSMCAASGTALVGLGIGIAVVALARTFISGKTAGLVLGIVVALLGICAAVVPGNVTPLCMMESMHCNAVMHPTALVCGAVVAIIAIVDVVRTARS